jgi:hypothetical protein
MTRAVVREVAAWAPGLATKPAWRERACAAQTIAPIAGAPDARFLPPLVRRRCDDLTRALLEVANESGAAEQLADCAAVFATRHASLTALAELLDALAEGRALSPNTFSHSVHNAPAGVFSVWANNRNACSSVAAGSETFLCGVLEGLGLLAREPARDVLLVCGDEYAPAPFTASTRPLAPTHAIALRFGSAGDGTTIELALETASEVGGDPGDAMPDELEFARWWYSESKEIAFEHGPRRWVFRR